MFGFRHIFLRFWLSKLDAQLPQIVPRQLRWSAGPKWMAHRSAFARLDAVPFINCSYVSPTAQ
jgi:hypothetical protein